MKSATFFCLMSFATLSQAQTNDEMMTEIDGKWKVDSAGAVTYSKSVNLPKLKKDVLFSRALSFYKSNYGTTKTPILLEDKVNGNLTAKGVYDTVHVGVSTITTYISTNYVLKVNVKEGQAILSLTFTDYEKKLNDGTTPPTFSSMKVEQEYPVNPNGRLKTVMTKAFYRSHKKALASLDALEKTILEGVVTKPVAVN